MSQETTQYTRWMRILRASSQMLNFLQSSVDGKEKRPELEGTYKRLIQAATSWNSCDIDELNLLLDRIGWPKE